MATRRLGWFQALKQKGPYEVPPDIRSYPVLTGVGGGNQRELARAKNQKKLDVAKKAATASAGGKGASLEERKHRDAEIMRQKQEKAAGGKKEEGATGGKK